MVRTSTVDTKVYICRYFDLVYDLTERYQKRSDKDTKEISNEDLDNLRQEILSLTQSNQTSERVSVPN